MFSRYHCDLNYAFDGDILHTVIVGQAEDESLSHPDNAFPAPGIFYDEVFNDYIHIYICFRIIIRLNLVPIYLVVQDGTMVPRVECIGVILIMVVRFHLLELVYVRTRFS